MPMQLRERKRTTPEPPPPKKQRVPKKKKDALERTTTTNSSDAKEEAASAPAVTEKSTEAADAVKLESSDKDKIPSAGAAESKLAPAEESKNEDVAEPEKPAEKLAEKPADTTTKTESATDGEKAKAEAATSDKQVKVGEQFPDITVEADDESKVNLKTVAESSGFVLFVYPKASTPGCTKQACGFRDNHTELTKAGYKVFGLSADKPKAQVSFKTKQNLPYTLLCDPLFTAATRLGMSKAGKGVIRSHIVVAKGGIIKDVKIQVSPADSVSEALKAVKA